MGLGMQEVLLILVIALIVFGPRKLPDLGKSLGQAMSQFRRASDDFKRTWEQEVESEKIRKEFSGSDYQYNSVTNDSATGDHNSTNEPYDPYNSSTSESDVARTSESTNGLNSSATQEQEKSEKAGVTGAPEPGKKHWI